MNSRYRLSALIGLLALASAAIAQQTSAPASQDVFVDENGVMRWGDTREEVYGFGINYTVPFAHAYRTAERLGVSHEKAITDDVYHFARLGFDLYRVHVWDCEISDTLGNLLENEHLQLFDYLLWQMKGRGMHFVITPIAFWGNGWPEPDRPTPGFSSKYGKDNCLTNEAAIRAQENYLFQFLNHVNPYTGVAYKDDPDIIAFEVSNEPHHRGTPQEVTTFIDRMTASMRKTGCRKPIFYNISHSVHLAEAYFDADIQGGTFQWYPTGLGFGKELGGNLLPHVDKYDIPFSDVLKRKQGARLVYEFDAADVGRSYIYPAMARSFREAGVQIATHFSYDPTYMAYANTEYNTHYMNLAYTPQKALSLMIASEVFHRIPLYSDFGSYPDNTTFGDFQLSYEEDLAELVSEKEFYYTNHTSSAPASPERLERIAGFGRSPLVKYEGLGAYFLDRIEVGVWRLEVMPDAVWVRNPFGRNSLDKEVAVINWKAWPVSIDLPDLGEGFTIKGLNEGNSFTGQAKGLSFEILPGSYLLSRKDICTDWNGKRPWKNILLGEFTAPASTVRKTYAIHDPPEEISAGQPLEVSATVIAPEMPDKVELWAYGAGWRPEKLEMQHKSGYTYAATIPGELIQTGSLRYYLIVKTEDRTITFPAEAEGLPSDWDFYQNDPYLMRVAEEKSPLYIFDAITDSDALTRRWLPGSRLLPAGEPGRAELLVPVEHLFREDPENKNAAPVYNYSFRYFFGEKIKGRKADLLQKKSLVFRGRALHDKTCKLQLALVMKDGSAFGGTIDVGTRAGDYILPLSKLKPVKLVTLPRPYPTFLPYYFESSPSGNLDLAKVESLQFSIGPGIQENEWEDPHGVAVESVLLK